MRKMFLAAFLAASVCGSAAVAQEEMAEPEISGIYAGSYVCSDGEHGFFLDLAVEDAGPEDSVIVSGTLGVFPVLAGKSGQAGSVAASFSVSGSIDNENNIKLEPGEWLVKPANYGAAKLEGKLSLRADKLWQIIGKPVVPGIPDFCTDLVATQFQP